MLLCAFEDSPDGGLGLADPFGEQGRAVHELEVGFALAGHGARKQRFARAWRTGEDDAVADGLTEFGCMGSSNPDEQTVLTFFNNAIPMLAKHPLVERRVPPWRPRERASRSGRSR